MSANLENSAVAKDWRRSVFIPLSKKDNAKECSNYHIIVLISHASKFMLKTLQARLQQLVNQDPPDLHAASRKGRGARDQIAYIPWITLHAMEFGEKKKSDSFTMLKTLTVWIRTNCRKFFNKWEYQTTLPVS